MPSLGLALVFAVSLQLSSSNSIPGIFSMTDLCLLNSHICFHTGLWCTGKPYTSICSALAVNWLLAQHLFWHPSMLHSSYSKHRQAWWWWTFPYFWASKTSPLPTVLAIAKRWSAFLSNTSLLWLNIAWRTLIWCHIWWSLKTFKKFIQVRHS